MAGLLRFLLLLLSVASLALGNIAAIAQTNFKRMLAYSTMSHIGFVLLGLLALQVLMIGKAVLQKRRHLRALDEMTKEEKKL